MPKIFGTSLDKYNKSCSAPHQKSRKIEFAFFRFIYDFLENLQDSAIWIYYWRCSFAPRILQRTKTSQLCPWFTRKTLGRSGASNWVPSPSRRRGSPDSAGSGGAFGRGGGGTRPQAHLGRRVDQSLGGDDSGGGARRRPAMTVAAARGNGEEGARLGNAPPGAVLRILRKVLTRAVAKRASKAAAC
jgi:hypothetical protein